MARFATVSFAFELGFTDVESAVDVFGLSVDVVAELEDDWP